MTAVSNDIQAQPATRSATDRQAGRKDGGGFDDALKTSDKEQKLKAEKQPNDEIRWTRFGRKLDAAIAIGRGTTTERKARPTASTSIPWQSGSPARPRKPRIAKPAPRLPSSLNRA